MQLVKICYLIYNQWKFFYLAYNFLRNCLNLQYFFSLEKAKKLGYKEPKDYKPMSTDLAQEYMIALVKDKKEKNPSSNIAVTQGVSFDSLINYTDPGSLEHSAILLANTYIFKLVRFHKIN